MSPIKDAIAQAVDDLADDLQVVSRYLLDNPEIAFKEFKALTYLGQMLKDRGFTVEEGVGGVATAFVARPAGCRPSRPTVALLAEYDALPKIGHGCGHNLIAPASIGAALALRRVLGEQAGGVVVVGTPAEEGGGGKVHLAQAGVFDQMDAAMMFHPSTVTIAGKGMLGRTKFTMTFTGRTAHAAGSPDKGINALDALILAYNNLNALRSRLRADARIHGIITHGGDAPNIIPDHAAGLFYVRAGSRAYRDEIMNQVRNCAQAAALATGAAVQIDIAPPVIDPLKRNLALEAAATANIQGLGIALDPDDGRMGSSDVGNLSHTLPTIHPYLAIADTHVAGHSVQFRDATMTPRGQQAMRDAAKMLAMTVHDFLTTPELREQVKAEFASGSAA
jgi:amidohydrolase